MTFFLITNYFDPDIKHIFHLCIIPAHFSCSKILHYINLFAWCKMADEDWSVDEPAAAGDTIPVAAAPELPEIKLFGRWSCDDVQVSDMSLQVC